MTILMHKTFENPGEVKKSLAYHNYLNTKLAQMGFGDDHPSCKDVVFYDGNQIYPGVIEVYIQTNDESLINALTIMK